MQRREPIRSTELRKAAAGQPCTVQFVGICCSDWATTVLSHVHDETFGMGEKADDTSGVHACHACHMAYDLHQTGLSEAEVLWYILRAMQRTLRNLVERKIIIVPLDEPKVGKPKPRKPPAQRKAVGGNSAFPKQPRPMQSRNDLRRRPKEKT